MDIQPTEPLDEVSNTDEPMDPNLRERLRNILDALSNCHKNIIQEYTLNTQAPVSVKELRAVLAQCSNQIESFLDGRTQTNLHDAVRICIDKIRPELEPITPEISTLPRYWCKIMFEEYPFSISPNHIENLYKNSVNEVDG